MKNNALILLWKGEDLSDYLVQKVAEFLVLNGICTPEMLTIKYKDEDGVANALLRDVSQATVVSTVKTDDVEVEQAVKNAVIYIGERFKDSLRRVEILNFTIELYNAVTTARRNISFVGVGTKDELLTAVEILSTANATIPSSLAKKYHFTQDVIKVIKKVYNSY